jgi:hypothetical protein
MKGVRATRHCRPRAEALEPRLVLDAAFPFAVAIGDTMQSGGTSVSMSSISRVGTDSAGNVYVAGNFANLAHFGIGPGEPTDQSSGDPSQSDVFIAKFSSTGTLIWHEALQPSIGSPSNVASVSLGGIAVDGAGDVFLTGTLQGSVNVNPTPGQQTILDSSNGAILLMKLAPDGTLDFAENLGAPSTLPSSQPSAMALDGQGHVLLTWEGNIASYNVDGSSRWAETIGGLANAITADRTGNILVTGSFSGTTNFDPGPGVYNLTGITRGTDIFALKLDQSGNFLWAKGMLQTSSSSNINDNYGSSVSTDSAGNVYLAGAYSGTVNFDPGSGSFTLTPGFNDDYGVFENGFVMKLDSSGNFAWAESPGANIGNDTVTVDSSGQVFVSGTTKENFVLGHPILLPSGSQVILPGNGIFVMRLDSLGELQGVRESSISSPAFTTGIAVAPGGNVAIVGTYNDGQTFGTTDLPQLTYGTGPTVASYFVAETSPIPNAPTGATLTQVEGGSSRTPSLLVSGVAPGTPVTLFDMLGGSQSLPPGSNIEVGSRIGPGVISATNSPSNSYPIAGEVVASSYYPIAGAGVVSNTVLVNVPQSDPSIFSPLGLPGFKNSDGTLIPAGGVTKDPQPIVIGEAGFATSVDLLDGSGNVLGTAQIPGGMLTESSFQIQLPKGLTGRIQLYLRARDSYGYTSPLTATSTITIDPNFGGGGGGGGGGGTGVTGPVVKAVTIVSPKRGPKVIQIVFSGRVGPVTVNALFYLSHYSLISAGHDRRFGTKDDKALKLSKVTYSAATQVVTLHTKQTLSTAYPLKFTISSLLSTGLYTAFLGTKAKG